MLNEVDNLRIDVDFILKNNIIAWSDQKMDFIMEDKTLFHLGIKKNKCELCICGGSEERVKELLYATWELLVWYDGYFYTPISYKVDGVEHELTELININYYITDKKWASSAQLLGRNKRGISAKTLDYYLNIRYKGRKEKSMNMSMFSSYFYLMSESYANLNIEHRLVLLMHICDGFALEFLNGNKKNNAGNINKVLQKLDCKKYKQGAKMLGISPSKAVDALGYTRNELTHYVYYADSLGSFMENPNTDTDAMVNLYAFYVLEAALRVAVIETVGETVEDDVKEYILDENLDWIRLEKCLDEECVLPVNIMRQMLQKYQMQYEKEHQSRKDAV